LADFGVPAPLTPISVVAVQGGVVLGSPLTLGGSGAATANGSVSATTGALSLLVFAQPASSGGLFGIDLTASGSSDPIFQQTQGVGQLFAARQITVTSAGSYSVQVSDLAFPASFSSFAAVVTQGTTHIGSIFGGGAFAFSATPGNYFINFIAQPGGPDEAGTYSLDVSPGPVVNLSSDATSVASGGTVNLTWTTQNTTDCTASGGWSGSQSATGGSVKSAALTAATTFTLTCSGEGVTATQAVSVAVTTPKSGGGGGVLRPELLLALSGALLLRSTRWRRTS
jgi:hypothetical protein